MALIVVLCSAGLVYNKPRSLTLPGRYDTAIDLTTVAESGLDLFKIEYWARAYL